MHLCIILFGIKASFTWMQSVRDKVFLSNHGLSGSLPKNKYFYKVMVIKSRLEMEKFNGTNFELWKPKMEDFLIDQYLWVAVSGTIV